ncbi:MAG: hypothetical protein A2175_02150 [Candidatus Nealsonbacteria bacterium RBG_13_42_11]|uniref:DDH domain-containing protein n=1 Tax=Candidatus Nealsonbacteria bacterium RBG_13_42_11 TaxID=1801663 RepID=A0A1G2DZF9_9BACT|nr:MAG: hypothetical protein A2175_02150 [Candidatus Nealsonbacteria bacterium RBG_13_42_11]
MEIKNLKKAAERITAAIGNKERIILYGDADLDGISSVIVMEETIKTLGGKVEVCYFPDREVEGYGINETALKFLKKYSPALLITVDCGIGNFKEIKLAKKLGFEIIILDHHEPLDKLPVADIIVDPKQKGDRYPFKRLAAAGVVFKVSELLLENSRKEITQSLKKSFLELVALATIADMMPRQSENRVFIEEGMQSIKNSFRPGIKAFFEINSLKKCPDFDQKISKIISILNVRDVKNRLPAGFRLLTSPSPEEAKKIIKILLLKNKTRKEETEKIIEEIEKRIENKKDPLIFEGDRNFNSALLSSVASIISRTYSKPTFLYKKMAEETQGTVRAPNDLNSVDLMKKCSKYLLTYGGHPQASGFRVKNKNLEKFRICLINNLKRMKK